MCIEQSTNEPQLALDCSPKKSEDANEVFNPTEIKLEWGKTITPYEMSHHPMTFGEMKRFWIPSFKFDLRTMLSIAASLSYLLAIVCLSAISSVRGKAAGGAIFLGIAFVLTYLLVNIAINQRVRTAICRCMAKRRIAKALWEGAQASEQIYCKDVFHTEKSLFYHFVVFRDGSAEIWDGDEEKAMEVSKFSLGPQVNLDANKIAKSTLNTTSPV
ncbi:hypothetical protein FGB62_104g021 [Gracilaria domingensis]|nr:hypothetical protein FGB62_104g021 [Gracilaria domingensis]